MELNEQQLISAIRNLTDDNEIYVALKQLFEQQIRIGVDALTAQPSQRDSERHWNAGYVYSIEQLFDRINEIRKAKIE
jgi:predicted transposase YbfD/YdcC|tara:strand:+ start:1083 stop:1316 length:234 start_codon:yes stop_codon:yes gene_type:complete